VNVAVLASTKGTDLQAIIDSIKKGGLDVNLKLVFSNKECYAVDRAKEQGFNTTILKPIKGEKREDYDRRVSELLEENEIELIVLVGYMRLFSSWFVKKYPGKIINIHPSLLPSFPGMDLDVHKEVLDYGCKVSGCTIHFVDEGMDTGPIIAQDVVKILNDETPESLKEKVQALEMRLYPEVIKLFSQGKITLEGRKVLIND
jgi:phosphoribosylglycinamide formyltransferase-1